jgi:hypothetical protein
MSALCGVGCPELCNQPTVTTRFRIAMCACAATLACSAPDPPSPDSETGILSRPQISAAKHAGSPPLHLLRPAPDAPARWLGSPLPLRRRSAAAVSAPLATAAQALVVPPRPLIILPGPAPSFEGLGESFTGPAGAFTVAGAPADPVGDVGPNHYVQMVNTSFAVFDKTGTPLSGPIPTNALFQAFAGQPGGPGLCASTNQGDGIVLYDSLADRWFLSQFSFAVSVAGDPTPPSYQCVALSRTPDPTGGYDLYVFGPYDDGTTAQAPALNDYAKFGVWPDAYYATYNMFTRTGAAETFVGSKVCAFDRASMLAGQPATQQCFQLSSAHGGLLPADLDGRREPPAGSPGYMFNYEGSSLQFWRFHVDWSAPAGSTLGPNPPVSIPVDTIVELCPTSDTCVPQPGTTTQLDTVGDRLMHRLSYRNFGDHEALMATHTVAAGGVAGIRWYELRNVPGQTLTTAPPVLHQIGTYAPDATWRWMGSIAQDQMGDIAVGFSASSAAEKPSIRYAGRHWDDLANTLAQGEATLVAGTGVQTIDPRNPQNALSRWGDYSALSVDPTDDCTFWYTNEYLVADGGNWHTRVGSFRLPACPPRFSVVLPACATSGTSLTATVTATDGVGTTLTTYAGPVTLTTSDPLLVLPATLKWVSGVASVKLTFRTAGAQTLTVADPVNANFTGTGSTTVGARGTGAAASYQIALAPAVAAGSGTSVTVTALDAQCNVAGNYAGTARFSSSDASAVVPPNTPFVTGVASLTATFQTPGSQSLTAIDTVSSAITGAASTTVVAPPSARVTSPADGATVQGAVVFSADATVGTGTTLTTLELLVDGTVVSTATASPTQLSWDTTQVANGAHVLSARAVDGLGATGTSGPATLTVNNVAAPPDAGSGGAGAGGHGGCGQPATADGAAIALTVLALATASRARRRARRW